MNAPPAAERDRALAGALAHLLNRADPQANATLAILRRATGGPARFEAVRALWKVIPQGTPDRHAEAYALVAALFAIYHQGRGAPEPIDGDLGASFARLARIPGSDEERASRRFAALLTSSAEGLPVRLRHAITLLHSAGVPVDWARLAADVRAWERDGEPVQRRWARSFVAGLASAEEAEEHASPPGLEGEPR